MVRGMRSIKLRQKAKFVKIVSDGTQFMGASPNQITLKAVYDGITAASYQWFRGTTSVGTNQNLIVANNQVDVVQVYKVKVTATDGAVYEESISLTKVNNGPQGVPGALPIQREWKTGNVYRNNAEVVDYVYHRATKTWWTLKAGYNNVTATANPGNQFRQMNSLEQLAVNLLIAEEANLAGFIFKDQKLVSQNPSPQNPNLMLDGINGKLEAKSGSIGEFEINEGLEYEKLTPPSAATNNTALLKKFKFDKDGFNVRDRNIYSGVWCSELNGAPVCVTGTYHIVDWEVSTGNAHYYLKIKGEGVYNASQYKGALWVDAVASAVPAIYLGKGGISIESGDFEMKKGTFKMRDADIAGLSLNLHRTAGDIVVNSEVYISVTNATALKVVQLPANPPIGRVVYVKRVGNGGVGIAANKPIFTNSVESSYVIPNQGDTKMFVFDGVNWQVS